MRLERTSIRRPSWQNSFIQERFLIQISAKATSNTGLPQVPAICHLLHAPLQPHWVSFCGNQKCRNLHRTILLLPHPKNNQPCDGYCWRIAFLLRLYYLTRSTYWGDWPNRSLSVSFVFSYLTNHFSVTRSPAARLSILENFFNFSPIIKIPLMLGLLRLNE